VAAAREAIAASGGAADGLARHRRRARGEAALVVTGAGLAAREVALAARVALARGADAQGLEGALEGGLALAESPAEVLGQRIGVVAADVVVGAVDGGAALVAGRRFGAAPRRAALLADAVARRVATDRGAV